MKRTWTKVTVVTLAAVLIAGVVLAYAGSKGLLPGRSLTASSFAKGSKGGFNWTMDQDGTMTVSGRGELPSRFIFDNPDVKSVVFDEDCEITALKEECIFFADNAASITINSTAELTIEKNAIFYSPDGVSPISVTINAPKVTIVGEEPFSAYDRQMHITVNADELVIHHGTMSGLGTAGDGTSTFTCPDNTYHYIPAGYVFKKYSMQEEYDRNVQMNRERDFWRTYERRLKKGDDYIYQEEEVKEILSPANVDYVFGGAAVYMGSRGRLTGDGTAYSLASSFSRTMDNSGTLTITGRGELPPHFIFDDASIKRIVFDKDCRVTTLKEGCICFPDNAADITINSAWALTIEKKAILYSSKGVSPISVTINAPKVTIQGVEPFFAYRRQLNITINADELIVYQDTMPYFGSWNSANTFACPANSYVYILDRWKETKVPLTSENAGSVFGGASVTINAAQK